MLSVIVPTFNERDNVRALLERTLPVLEGLGEETELLVVDDDSPDGTAAAVQREADRLGASARVRVLVRKEDRGLAQAVAAGFRAARGDVVAVMDADLSHPPEILPALLAPIRAGEVDITVGSRRVPGGGVDNWPLRRRLASWVASLPARPLVAVRDTTSGFFAVRRALLRDVELKPIGYKIGLEVLVRTGARRVREVPFVFPDRQAGASKLGGDVMWAYLRQLEGLYRARFPLLSRFVQYALVGASGLVVDALVFAVLYHVAGLSSLGDGSGAFVAQAGAFGAAVACNFLLNRAWTFRGRAAHARFAVYAGVCGGGYVLRVGLLALLGAGGWLHPGTLVYAAPTSGFVLLTGLLGAGLWNFAASARWAFPARGRAVLEASERRAGRILGGVLLAVVVVHLIVSGVTDLAGDEAYYWQWARPGHLAAGYHDHPPMVAYGIALGTALAGAGEIGVRLLTIAWLAGLGALVYVLTGQWVRASGGGAPPVGPRRAGLWAAIAFLAMPLISVNGLLATPDTPLLFFWTATLCLTVAALRTFRLGLWILTGLALGLGLLSKYHMGLLPLSLLVALLLSRRGRQALRTPGPYVAVAAAVVLCLPFTRWLVESEAAGLRFQLGHGMDRGDERDLARVLRSVGEFFVLQLAFVTPVLLALVVALLAKAARTTWRRARGTAQPASELEEAVLPVLVVPAVAVLGLFATASLFASPEGSWPSVAYPSAFALAGATFARWHAARGSLRRHAWVAVGIALAASGYAHLELAHPLLVRGGFFSKVEPRVPLAAWAHAQRQSRGEGGRRAPVTADSYRTASLLAFYLPDRPPTAAPFEYGSGEQYAHWEHEVPLPAGAYAWFFTRGENDPRVPLLLRDYELVSRYRATRLGKTTRTYYAWWGRLRGEPIERAPLP